MELSDVENRVDHVETNLNCQGMSRGNKDLMSSIVAEAGHTFVSVDLCLPPTTEVLTKKGFVKLEDLVVGEDVWQVDPTTLSGSWITPSRIVDTKFTGDMVSHKTVRGTLTTTRDHTLLWVGQVNHPTRLDKRLYRKITKAGDSQQNLGCHMLMYSEGHTTSNYSEKEIDLACMFNADGYLCRPNDIYSIEVSRPVKRERVSYLLGKAGKVHPPRQNQTMESETWSYNKFRSPLLHKKEFDLSSLGADQADFFVECLKRWDGSNSTNNKRTGRISWGTVREKEANEVQAYLVKSGYEASLRVTYKDGKPYFYHLSIRKKGVIRFNTTKTTRPSGSSSGAAVVFSPVRDYRVMCVTVDTGFILVRQEGKCFVTGNCAGEPTVASHFSKDERYTYFNFTGVGKEPFYKDKILMIDDMYLGGASVSPTGKGPMKEMFHSSWGGVPFVEQWMINKDVVKKDPSVKKVRKFHKPQILGMGYGMAPPKMVINAADSGFQLRLSDAKDFHRAFWYDLFPDYRKLGERLRLQNKVQGYIVNDFGFRLFPSSFKAMNYFIQSSVSGIIDMLMINFYTLAPWCLHHAVIHDELVLSVPTERLAEAKTIMGTALQAMNNSLGWSIDIRTGWVEGQTFFEAH